LGLGAALLWGLADYFAAVASRSRGALRVVLGFHLAALVTLTALVLATKGLARVSLTQVAVLVGVGAFGWVSYLAFYGALAIGPISVLSPIVSGYAAVTVLLAVVMMALAAALLADLAGEFDVDSWLALVAGRDVWHNGLPHHETLTVIAHGAVWIDQQWLSQLASYGLYLLGGLGLLGVCIVALFASRPDATITNSSPPIRAA